MVGNDRDNNQGPSFAAKAAAFVGFSAGALYLLAKAREGLMPSHRELCFLLSSENAFSATHAGIMRRLANACDNNVDKMMAAIEIPALQMAGAEVAQNFPPAVLPKGTQYAIHVQYPDAVTGRVLNSNIDLYPETGAKVYETARNSTIRDYCVKNVFPVLRQMFSDCIRFFKQGFSDNQVATIINNPVNEAANIVLPAASIPQAVKYVPAF